MTNFQVDDTIGTIVRDYPALSRLFEKAQMDYCCGGQRTLAEACVQRGIDPEKFLAELTSFVSTDPSPVGNLGTMSLAELTDQIERLHHAYLHSEFPRIESMTTKVAKVHGDKDHRLLEVKDIFFALSAELETHLMKEEQILFPMIRDLEASDSLPVFHCGTIANPIQQMLSEHDQAGEALVKLRQLTDDFTPPDWACNTYRALLDALLTFEQDMHQHIHKENNVLFPRAIALEQSKNS